MTICMYFVSACDLHRSACVCFVHPEPVSVCVYICVCGSRVSVWEELNTWTSITVMWATWDPTASLHHGHTAITSTAATEREREEGNRNTEREMGEEVGDKKERETHTHGYKRRWLHIYIWEQVRETERQTDVSRKKDLHEASALHENSPLFPLVDIFLLVLTAMCLVLPAERSASGCHVLTLNQTIFLFQMSPASELCQTCHNLSLYPLNGDKMGRNRVLPQTENLQGHL